jgi:hypothetical protein
MPLQNWKEGAETGYIIQFSCMIEVAMDRLRAFEVFATVVGQGSFTR